MGLIPAKCTQCGGNIKVDDTKEAGVCEFCGTEFIMEKVVNYYQISAGNVIVDSDNINRSNYDIEAALKTVDKFMTSKLYNDAEELIKQIIQNAPYDYRGWWQMALLAYHQKGYWFDNNKNYEKALGLANDPERLKAYRDKEFNRIWEEGRDIVTFCENPNKNKLHKIYVSVGGMYDPNSFLSTQYLGLEVINNQLTQVSYSKCNGRYVKTVKGPVTLKAEISVFGSKVSGYFYDENDKRMSALYISDIIDGRIAVSGISPQYYNVKYKDRIKIIRGDTLLNQKPPRARTIGTILIICCGLICFFWMWIVLVYVIGIFLNI